MKIARVPKLALSFLVLTIEKLLDSSLSLSNISQHDQKLPLLLHKFITEVRFSHLAMFLAFSLLIVTILLGSNSSRPSSSSLDFDHISFLAPLEHALAYQGEMTNNNIVSNQDSDNESSVFDAPRSVYVEIEEQIKVCDSESDEDSDGFHGYDGYDEDNDDDGSDEDDGFDNEEEDDDDDLKRRIEEFIAKNNRKWKEEMLKDKGDKLLYLAAEEWQF